MNHIPKSQRCGIDFTGLFKGMISENKVEAGNFIGKDFINALEECRLIIRTKISA